MSTARLSVARILLFILALSSIALLRYFPESISNPIFSKGGGIYPIVAIHYFLFYTATFFSFVLLLYFATKQNIGKIINDVLIGSFFVIFPPIIDLFFNKGSENTISYFLFSSDKLVQSFLTFGLTAEGISLGSKIIGICLVLAVVIYVWKKTAKILNTALAAFGAYLVIFLCAALPNISIYIFPNVSGTPLDQMENIISNSWYAKNLLPDIYLLGNRYMAMLWWLVSCLLLLAVSFISRKDLVYEWAKHTQWIRSFYYLFLAFIGIKLAGLSDFIFSLSNIYNFLTLSVFLITCLLGVWLSIIINDLFDVDIDRTANPGRPLISGKIHKEEYVSLAFVFALVSGSGLFLIGGNTALALLVGQALYFFYSVPPFRLKRNFVFSSLSTGLAGSMVVVSTFFLANPIGKMNSFPLHYGIFFFVLLALIGNIKDIKDFIGDKENNIKTIPVVFGQRMAIDIIAVLYLICVVATPLVMHKYFLFIPAIIYGLILYFYIKKTPFKEKAVFPFIYAFFLLIAIFI